MAVPAIILVGPQLGENIGMAARAMRNFGLSDLRLVHPRCRWPNRNAEKTAVGALPLVQAARVFADLGAAIADLRLVYAATARPREMPKPVSDVRTAAGHIRGERLPAGILFGREATGLTNDEIALADAVLAIPSDPEFASLNLSHAVAVAAHAWRTAAEAPPPAVLPRGASPPATKDALLALFAHLERELDASGFFLSAEKRPSMARNLRAALTRAQLSEQEVRTLRGVVTSLVAPHGTRRDGAAPPCRRPRRPRRTPP